MRKYSAKREIVIDIEQYLSGTNQETNDRLTLIECALWQPAITVRALAFHAESWGTGPGGENLPRPPVSRACEVGTDLCAKGGDESQDALTLRMGVRLRW
jgi:hypothetical protein